MPGGGSRPDSLQPSPGALPSEAQPSVVRNRGWSGDGTRVPTANSHSMSSASTRAVLIPASLPTAVAAPAPADMVSVPHDKEPAIMLVPFTLSVHAPGQ